MDILVQGASCGCHRWSRRAPAVSYTLPKLFHLLKALIVLKKYTLFRPDLAAAAVHGINCPVGSDSESSHGPDDYESAAHALVSANHAKRLGSDEFTCAKVYPTSTPWGSQVGSERHDPNDAPSLDGSVACELDELCPARALAAFPLSFGCFVDLFLCLVHLPGRSRTWPMLHAEEVFIYSYAATLRCFF